MRLVFGYLIQRTFLWSFLLTAIAFTLLALCQFLLTERVNYGSSLSHALYFASVFAGALVIVQWRRRSGDTLIECMGYPKWSLPIPIGLISGALIICALSQVPSTGLSKTTATQLHWKNGQASLTVNADHLATHEQRVIFKKLVTVTEESEHPAWIFLVAILIPITLNFGLIYWTSQDDTWTPIILTASTYAVVELWIRSYG